MWRIRPLQNISLTGSFASMVLDVNYVSADHCPAGSDKIFYTIEPVRINSGN